MTEVAEPVQVSLRYAKFALHFSRRRIDPGRIGRFKHAALLACLQAICEISGASCVVPAPINVPFRLYRSVPNHPRASTLPVPGPGRIQQDGHLCQIQLAGSMNQAENMFNNSSTCLPGSAFSSDHRPSGGPAGSLLRHRPLMHGVSDWAAGEANEQH